MAVFLNQKENKKIIEYTKRLKRSLGKDLLCLKLFGSKVRGDFTKDSDIDILIIVKEKSLNLRNKIYDILFEIDPYYELKISPRIFSEFEYKENERLNSPFIAKIEKEGIKL